MRAVRCFGAYRALGVPGPAVGALGSGAALVERQGGDGWLMKVSAASLPTLLSHDEYRALTGE